MNQREKGHFFGPCCERGRHEMKSVQVIYIEKAWLVITGKSRIGARQTRLNLKEEQNSSGGP